MFFEPLETDDLMFVFCTLKEIIYYTFKEKVYIIRTEQN